MDMGHELCGVFVNACRLEVAYYGAFGTRKQIGNVAIGELELLVEAVDDGHSLFGTKVG